MRCHTWRRHSPAELFCRFFIVSGRTGRLPSPNPRTPLGVIAVVNCLVSSAQGDARGLGKPGAKPQGWYASCNLRLYAIKA